MSQSEYVFQINWPMKMRKNQVLWKFRMERYDRSCLATLEEALINVLNFIGKFTVLFLKETVISF